MTTETDPPRGFEEWAHGCRECGGLVVILPPCDCGHPQVAACQRVSCRRTFTVNPKTDPAERIAP